MNGTTAEMRPNFVKSRQYGVGIPGGCEGLVYFRQAFEASLKRDSGSPLVVLDSDLKNAFPFFEWEHIRASVDNHAPGVAAWTR